MAYNYQGGGNVSHGEFGSIGDALAGRNRYNIQTAQFDPTRVNEERNLALGARNQQQELAQAIQNRAMGRGGPSVAELQMQRGLGQAQQAAAQQAAGARGVDRAAAFRQAQMGQANMAADANSQAAMLRAQEQIQAQQLGAQQLQGIREQDIGSRQLSTQEQIAQMQAQTAAEQARSQQAAGNAENLQKLGGGVATAAGSLLTMSDMRAKEDIRPINPREAALMRALDEAQRKNVGAIQSRENLGPVQPYSYRYKPEAAAAMGTDTGPREGVMAQDLQRSPAYQSAVVPTPQGLALDKDRLLQANTAELGGVDKRLRELEAAQAGAIRRVNAPVNDDEEKLKRALDRAGPKAVKRVQEPIPKAAAR